MPITEVSATQYQCDGCGAISFAAPKVSQPGYTGSVVRTAPGGFKIRAKWYAHTSRCIAKAVKTSISRALQDAAKGGAEALNAAQKDAETSGD